MARIWLLLALVTLTVVMAISGCSELRIIGVATVRELTSDAINVEQASYQLAEQKPEAETTKVAQAPPRPMPAKKKAEQKKGLWETR